VSGRGTVQGGLGRERVNRGARGGGSPSHAQSVPAEPSARPRSIGREIPHRAPFLRQRAPALPPAHPVSLAVRVLGSPQRAVPCISQLEPLNWAGPQGDDKHAGYASRPAAAARLGLSARAPALVSITSQRNGRTQNCGGGRFESPPTTHPLSAQVGSNPRSRPGGEGSTLGGAVVRAIRAGEADAAGRRTRLKRRRRA